MKSTPTKGFQEVIEVNNLVSFEVVLKRKKIKVLNELSF